MEEMVFQIGPIRPPSEANSLLLRVTINCPWNKCKFCMLYKKYDFHTRPVEDVKKDIDTMAELRDRILQYKKDYYQIRQNSHYDKQGKSAPDNNLFWEERSNPLSSKGN